MALKLLTIHRINSGRIAPFEISTPELIAIQARRHANWFRNSSKTIEDNELAQSYKSKMNTLANRIIVSNDGRFANDMLPNFTKIIGDVETEESIMTKDIDGWEELVENHINELFELASGVTPEEKTAYDNYDLPE